MSDAARATGVGAVSTWSRTPWFLTLPPEHQDSAITRSHVIDAVEQAAQRHAVVAVGAPSGYGKSTAVAQWARSTGIRVAWLSLTRFDGDPGRVSNGVIAALHRVLDTPQLFAATGADYDAVELGLLVDGIVAALDELGEPVALVVDQAECAEDLGASLVGALAAKRPAGLSLIVVGTKPPHDILRALGRPLGAVDIDSNLLSFTTREVRDAAQTLLAHDIGDATAQSFFAATGGWPIAVRMALLSREAGVERDLADYVDDAVLSDLPAGLAEFVRATAIAARLDDRLAARLSDRADARGTPRRVRASRTVPRSLHPRLRPPCLRVACGVPRRRSDIGGDAGPGRLP